MSRDRNKNKVFISYSHKDEKFLKEFRTHLTFWEDEGLLECWSDHQIGASQDWQQKIQSALESSACAVLLVSPDFLASEYIRKNELPYLLQARTDNKLALACLYIRHSAVNDDDTVVGVQLSSGETIPVKLTQYQGLNDPQHVVAALSDHKRDQLYAKAATELKTLVALKNRKAARSLTGERFELTVQLGRDGAQLTRRYLHHYGPLAEHRSAWQPPNNKVSGETLFEALFASSDQCEKVLRILFNLEPARPSRYPVRIRIQSDDPILAGLPWAAPSWEGSPLLQHGWTFELIAPLEQAATPHFSNIALNAPCPVLMIAPSDAAESEHHHRDIEERLKHAWRYHDDPPLFAKDWQAVEQAWRSRRPYIIYYYGPAESDGKTLSLLLDSPQGGVDRRPLTDLARLWSTNPPLILFCNLVGALTSPGIAMAALNVPLAITQSSTDGAKAQSTALAWFYELLESGEDTDPIWALHQHVPDATAWGAYDNWRTRTMNIQTRDKLARLLLDRKFQRSLGLNVVNELVRDRERRLCCVLAYGSKGNLVEKFTDQLYEHLRRDAKEVARIIRLPLLLPTGESFARGTIETVVRRALRLGDHQSFSTALRARIPPGPGRARPVLLIEWKMRRVNDGNRLSRASLQAWLEFCSQQLGAECPKELRLVSCLPLEIAEDRHEGLAQAMKKIHAEGDFHDRAFRFELLPPLDHVETSDLANFLGVTDNSSCPPDLLKVIPELIVQKTGGQFEQTVQLVEQAEREGWHRLHDTLVTEVGLSVESMAKEEKEEEDWL